MPSESHASWQSPNTMGSAAAPAARTPAKAAIAPPNHAGENATSSRSVSAPPAMRLPVVVERRKSFQRSQTSSRNVLTRVRRPG